MGDDCGKYLKFIYFPEAVGSVQGSINGRVDPIKPYKVVISRRF